MPYESGSPSYELPSRAADIPAAPVMPNGGAERQLSRQAILGLTGKLVAGAVVGAAGLELGAPEPAHADSEPPTTPSNPPTAEERAELAAQTAELKARAELEKAQRKQIEDDLNKPWYKKWADSVGGFAGPLAVTSGILGGMWTVRKHFVEKAKDLQSKEEATRLGEDDSYKDALDKINDALSVVIKNPQSDEAITMLHLAHSQLETFATNERFAARIFDVAAGLLRDRAMALASMSPEQIGTWVKRRRNAHREVFKLLYEVLPQLPREDANGEATLPNADGISLTGMNYMRHPLERLSLEGAYLQELVITGSLAGSYFKLARLNNATFGEPDAVCDLRGADFSKADMGGAVFAHVLIDKHTKFGAGQEGNPCATFESVISNTLTPAQVQEKIAAARAVIKTWQQEHPNSGDRAEASTGG